MKYRARNWRKAFQNPVICSSVGFAGRAITEPGVGEDATGCEALGDVATNDVDIVVAEVLDTEDTNEDDDCVTTFSLVEDWATDCGEVEELAPTMLDTEEDALMLLDEEDDGNEDDENEDDATDDNTAA